jgi:hypothetical protein
MPYYAFTKKEGIWATCRLIRVASAILGQFIMSITFAFAQSATSTIEEFGLFGVWADDCRSGPSPSNQHASFSVTSRSIIQLHNAFGPDYGDMLYRIVGAKRIGNIRISLRQLLTTDDQVALDIVMLKSDRYRHVEIRRQDSRLVVARRRRERIRAGRPDPGRQQSRNHLDGAL